MHGSQGFPPQRGRVTRFWGITFLPENLGKLLHQVKLVHFADVEPDFATPQGVVHVAVRVVEKACVKDVLQVVMGDQPGSDPADAGVLNAFVSRRR